MGVSFGYNLHDRWGSRFDPNKACVDAIHATKIAFWINVKKSQTSGLPLSAKMNSEATVVGKCVADPVGVGATLDHDDDVAAVVEITHGNTVSFA